MARSFLSPHYTPQQQQLLLQPPSQHYHPPTLPHRTPVPAPLDRTPAPTPLDHGIDYASILAYRQRVNGGSGALTSHHHPPHHQLARSLDAEAWSQRPHSHGSTLHSPPDHHRIALDDDARFRQAVVVREFRDSREEPRRSDSFLSELDISRRSAVLSAKLFLDEERSRVSDMQRSGFYENDSSTADITRGYFAEREVADHQFLRNPQRITDRGLRKRNRDEETDMERGRVSRHKRFHDPGLAVLPRTPDASGGPPLLRRVLTAASRFNDIDDREDGQVFTTSKRSRPSTPPTKSSKKQQSLQHVTPQAKTIQPEWRAFPPNSPSLSRRVAATDERSASAKGSGFPLKYGTKSVFLESYYKERGVTNRPTSIPGRELAQLFADRSEDVDQSLNRHDHLNLSSKWSKKLGVEPSGTPSKDKNNSDKKDQKEQKQSKLTDRSFSVVEAKPRKSMKPRFARVNGSDAKVCGTASKSKKSDRAVARGLHSEERYSKKGSSPCDVQQDDRSLRPEDGVLHSSKDAAAVRHFQSISIKQQEVEHADMQAEVATNLKSGSKELQPSEVQAQNLTIGSKNRTETSLTSRGLSATQDASVFNQQSPDLSETARAPFQLHEQSPVQLSFLSSTLGRTSSNAATFLLPSSGNTESDPAGVEMQQLEISTSSGLGQMPLLQGGVLEKNEHLGSALSPIISGAGSPNHDAEKHTVPMVPNTGEFLRSGRSQPCFEEINVASSTEMECHSLLHVASEHGFMSDIPDNSRSIIVSSLPNLYSVEDSKQEGPQPSMSDKGSIHLINTAFRDWAGFVEPVPLNLSKGAAAEKEVRLFGKSLTASVAESRQENSVTAVVEAGKADSKVVSAPELPNEQRASLVEAKAPPDRTSEAVVSKQGVSPVETEAPPDRTSGVVVSPHIGCFENQGTFEEASLGTDKAGTVATSTPSEHQGTLPKTCATENKVLPAITAGGGTRVAQVVERGMKTEPFPLIAQDRQANHMPSKQPLAGTHQPRGRVRAGAHTWRRPGGNTQSAPVMQPVSRVPATSQASQFFGNQKGSELASYVRKGNSLVRASMSPAARGINSLVPGKEAAGKVLSPVPRLTRIYPFQNTIKSTRAAFKQVFSTKKLSSNEDTAQTSSFEHTPAAPHALDSSTAQDTSGAVIHPPVVKSTKPLPPENLSVPGTTGADEPTQAGSYTVDSLEGSKEHRTSLTSGAIKNTETSLPIYVKSKANQLIASLPPASLGSGKSLQPGVSQSVAAMRDLYYKKKENQLVRNVTEMTDTSSSPLKSSQGATIEVTRGQAEATTSRKAHKRQRHALSSRVWTLKGGPMSQARSVLPLLLPWKRQGLGVNITGDQLKALRKGKKGSLLFLIRKLQRLRKLQPVYTRSSGGFSLHRSGVLSISGANLKWTKSIEKRSKQASEEATKAVAAVEKRRREEVVEAATAVAKAKAVKRVARQASRRSKLHSRERIITVGLVRYKMDASRRTLQRLPDQWGGDNADASSSGQTIGSALLSTPRRLSIGGTEYVRIGHGHQLVRDPKAATRALANEKVRWSLHSARLRRAKSQQFCLFYTRFGKCNKGAGKCPYIHDPEKVAVCTKFLKGTCSGSNCLFSHKVIPERMPDCSYFLEGLCTNENCPYRHVSVNPKASVCEGFLKGFCVNGDECNKKHTLVCPAFASTGECPDRSACKLHHPKSKGKRVLCVWSGRAGMKRKRRYFVAGAIGFCEQKSSTQPTNVPLECDGISMESGTDFIPLPRVEIDFDETDELRRKLASLKQQVPFLQDDIHSDMDLWIKPVLLLQNQTHAVSS